MIFRASQLWILGGIACVLFMASCSKSQSSLTNQSVSIRTMSTGESIYADGKGTELNWNLVEVMLPGYLTRKFPFGAVQFRHISKDDKCLMSNGLWLSVGECSAVKLGDHRTLFSLLPTSSGALQIQSIATEGCLVVESSGKKIAQSIRLQPCFTNAHAPIDLRWLWVLTPPVIDAKLAP